MAPRGGTQRGGRGNSNTFRRDADFSYFLTAAQKNELQALATSIMEGMLQQVCLIFEPPTKPLQSNVAVNIVPQNNPVTVTFKTYGKNDKGELEEKGENEETGGVQPELKKDAIAAFKKWQAMVAKRFTEISVVTRDPPQQSARTPNGKPWSKTSKAIGDRFGRTIAGGKKWAIDLLGDKSKLTQKENRRATNNMPAVSSETIMQFPNEKRHLLLHCILLLLLSLESYTAYSRAFVLRMATHLRVPIHVVISDEVRIARGISHAAQNAYTENYQSKIEEVRKERRTRGGSGSMSSSAASLDTPLIEAHIGSVSAERGIGSVATAGVLGSMGTLADGGLAACIFFGLCGPRGSVTKTLDVYTKDIPDISLVPLHGEQQNDIQEGTKVQPQDRRLRLSIGISGWACQNEDDVSPWRVLRDNSEAYALGWEDETLLKVGAALKVMAASLAWQNAKKDIGPSNGESPSHTTGFPDLVLTGTEHSAGLGAFSWPEGLLKISKIVDNPWGAGMVRADKVGQAMADAIINKAFGERSISLLGYGLGARVIYTCLMSLSERRAFGLVENVIMIGTPAPSVTYAWTALRSAVFGRVINVFSENDSMLAFLHRTGCIQFGVAGLQRIQGVYGIENVDATKPLSNHLRYAHLVGKILKDVGWEDLDMKEVAKSEEALVVAEKEQERQVKNQKGQSPSKPGRKTGKDGKKRNGKKKLEEQFQALRISG